MLTAAFRLPALHFGACALVLATVIGARELQRFPTAPTEPAFAPLVEAAPAPVADVPVAMPLPSPEPSVDGPPAEPLPEARAYVVEPGDTVRTISQQFGVSNETIIWANDLTDPDVLQAGQALVILPFTGLIHEVRPGDTVASIANGYDAELSLVIAANRLTEPYVIVSGQKLTVPGGYRAFPKRVVLPSAETVAAADRAQGPPGASQQAAASAPLRRLPRLGSTPQEQFIGSIAEAAVESYERTGVPASVTVAQAILETYWGSSRLARESNNYFGIKAQTRPGPAGVVWLDVWEVVGGRNVVRPEPFRAYDDIADSFVDHGRFFLENPRYAPAMAAREDPRQFAREINRAGYATDPAYAVKLISLMDRYDLYRFDE